MNDDIELSRRRTLAALGTIGAASAGAGLGTSAYFSDQETFQNNQLVAGELDMKVDWEEHYSDWSDDEDDGGVDVTMSEPGSPGDYYTFPVGADDADLWVNQTDDPLGDGETTSRDLFMDNTSLEAYPDGDNDGVQDDFMDSNVCTDDDPLADVPDNIDPTQFNRTNNADTYDDDAGEPLPLINLDDVKPGDFGEVTFSFHLCTNPGYVWMNADNVTAAENGVTEPEADDPDEIGPEDEEVPADSDLDTAEIELLDEIQTCWWYDEDCDNLLDASAEQGQAPCVQLVLDDTGSMSTNTDNDDVTRLQEEIDGAKALADGIIDAGGKVGVTFFSTGLTDSAVVKQSVDDSGATNKTTTRGVIDDLIGSGRTDIASGIRAADNDLSNCEPGEEAIQIVVTDGLDNEGESPSSAADDVTGTDADDYTDEIFAVGTGGATESSLLGFARPMNDDHTFLTEDPSETLEDLLNQLGEEVITGEEIIFNGSLRAALQALTAGNGIPLSPPGSDFNEVGDEEESADPPDADARECFMGETTQCIGFSWWLPLNHGNEVQSDSVGFDLGFYTEQCRHNTGSGMNNENVDPDEIDA
jgi:predicted ribosomally synthesized peptide with SipW-like signal peptide